MRKLGQVLRRVGHGKCETVDQLGVAAFPQPRFVGTLLQFVGHFLAQFVQRGFRQLGACLAVIARVFCGWLDAHVQAIGGDLRDGRLTGRLLAIPQDLAQKRPQNDRRGVDAVLAEEPAMAGECLLNPFAGEDVRERQRRPGP